MSDFLSEQGRSFSFDGSVQSVRDRESKNSNAVMMKKHHLKNGGE